jgi:hypothetical protein
MDIPKSFSFWWIFGRFCSTKALNVTNSLLITEKQSPESTESETENGLGKNLISPTNIQNTSSS